MSEFSITYNKDKNLAIGVHSGTCGFQDTLNSIKIYYQGTITKYSITDFSKAQLLSVTGKEIEFLAEYMVQASKVRPPGSYDFLVVPDLLKYGLARMYHSYLELTTKSGEHLKTEVYRTMEEALAEVDKKIALER
jgi:hypothetical protein